MADASTSGLIVRLQHSPNHFRQRRVLGDRVDGDPPRDRPRPGPRENPDRQQLIVVKGLDVVAQHRNSSSQAVTKLLSRNVDARVDNRLVQCGCLRPFVTRRRRLRSLVLAARHLSTLRRPLPTRHAQRVRRAPSTRRRQRRRTHRPRRRRRVTLRVSEYAESSSLTSSSRDQVCATMPPNDQWRRKKRDHLDSMAPPPTLTSSPDSVQLTQEPSEVLGDFLRPGVVQVVVSVQQDHLSVIDGGCLPFVQLCPALNF